MMHIWITRTEPGASILADAINQLDVEWQTAVVPTIAIEPTQDRCPIEDVNAAVFLSAHAVEYSLRSNTWRPACAVAVGPATAESLKSFDIEAHVPSEHTSEGILHELHNWLPSPEANLVIVCGRQGRGVLFKALIERNFSVHEWTVYQRVVRVIDCVEKVNVGDLIVVGSNDGLRSFANQWSTLSEIDKDGVTVLVPSKRVEHTASILGFNRVVNCAGASASSVIEVLKSIASHE